MDKGQPESSLHTAVSTWRIVVQRIFHIRKKMDEPAIKWSKTFVILKVWRDGRRNLDSSSEMIDGLCEALSKLDRSDLVEFVQYGEFIECAVN